MTVNIAVTAATYNLPTTKREGGMEGGRSRGRKGERERKGGMERARGREGELEGGREREKEEEDKG